MTGRGGDAFDWALALARAPGERLVLRQRPLPEGIDVLLQIAAGHGGDALASAVSRSGETEESLVETVRFYLREVLFHSGADAYRILGLERGASQEKIKGHHRWLQQWLHPDRHTSDWDAIFAGRVNAAWNALRTTDKRRVYDVEHPLTPITTQHLSQPHGSVLAAGWVHPPVPVHTARERWLGRAPVLALLVACAGLGLLALRDLANDQILVALAPGAAGKGNQAEDDSSGQADRPDLFERLQLPPRSSATPRTPMAKAPSTRDADRSTAMSRPVSRTREEEPPAPSSRERNLAPSGQSAVVGRPSQMQPPPPTRDPPETLTPLQASSTFSAPAPTRPAPTRSAPLPVQEAERASAPVATIAPARPEATPAVTAERVRQAQQVGDRLLAFMKQRSTKVPPIWDSLAAQNGAGQLRDELLEGGSAGFSEADWRVGAQDAQLQVDVVYPDGREGRLAAGLVWREKRWLVSRLSMERDW